MRLSVFICYSTLIARIKEIYSFLDEAESTRVISGIQQLGLLSDEQVTIKEENVFDMLCHQLAQLLSFKPHERGLVMLQHKFIVE